jgi:glycosyltransferase involved in cell wall biosynthesis
MKRPYLSIVIPVFNEEESLQPLVERLSTTLAAMGKPHEIIFVDDGSADGSSDILKELSKRDARVKVVRLSRNFGQQAAIVAGLDRATGENIVVMDADLQDPPETIPDLLAKREEGYDVVYAARESRSGETPFKIFSARVFYRLLNKLSGLQLPEEAGDFRLLSRRAADELRRLREQHPYVRGLASWIGFPQAEIRYARAPRAAGKTKYPLRDMAAFAIHGITSFSIRPLRLATWLGFFVATVCFAYMLYILIMRLIGQQAVHGWPSTIIAVLFLGAVQLICLGIIGEYIGKIYDEGKGRPRYIVLDETGFEHSPDTTSPDRTPDA